jgi:hypothetical protein
VKIPLFETLPALPRCWKPPLRTAPISMAMWVNQPCLRQNCIPWCFIPVSGS